jgi:phosphoribosylformylglycinamidine synthase
MASRPPILIITGHGVNCEAESRHAWELAGAEVSFLHLHDLLDRPGALHGFAGMMFIGGFSYGDHMGSGQVMAQRIRSRVREDLQRFIEDGKLILGVCNGFQVMVKLGLLPGLGGRYFDQVVALMQNDCGTFQNFWVELAFEAESPCVFTRGLDRMPLPVRHGEGKVFTLDKKVLAAAEEAGCVACRYVDPATGRPAMTFPENPNGSLHAIAGLTDPTGRIFGLMPHPEAYLYPENHPHWDFEQLDGKLPKQGLGLALFTNAVNALG